VLASAARTSDGVSLLERIRRFWATQPEPDHPLTEEERDEKAPATGHDEWAHLEQEFVGEDLDPDERRGS
jgi:hypothetical protein